MLSLHDAIKKIYNTKWTLTSNFAVFLETTSDSQKLWKECNLPTTDLNLYLKDFRLPQCGSSTPIEDYINDRYRISQGVFDPVTITLTFKDYNSFSLYRSFLQFLYESRYRYPNEYLINIKVLKLRDHTDLESNFTVMSFEKCMIKNVSEVTLSNETESQIAEFSVEFKTSKEPTISL